MRAFFMLYRIWFQIAAVAALAGGLWWGVHTYNESLREDGRQEMRVEYQAKLLQAYKDKVAIESGFSKRIGEANANYAKRQTILNANLATAGIANRSLLDDLANIRRGLPDDTASSLTARADTLADVLGRCSTAHKELAGTCDRIANDLQRTLESWPKIEPK